jgi:DNA-binding PadR family transcriptional regulator
MLGSAEALDKYGGSSYSLYSYSSSRYKEPIVTHADKSSEPQIALTPAMFQVLLALGDEEKHGYAVLKDVEEQSGGEVRLSTGTLYAIIKRLLSEGLIKECRSRSLAVEDDQRRRYYRLTPLGRQMAMDEAERMERLIATAREKHLLKRLRPVHERQV